MQLEECYNLFGGSYQEVKMRLHSDNLIHRFVIKFLDDKSYEQIDKALESENYDEAFRGAHTLKGICQNLGFDKLGESSGELTELLRKRDIEAIDEDKCNALWQRVSKDYSEVVNSLNKLS